MQRGMDRPVPGQPAAVKGETFDREVRGHQQGIAGQKLLQPFERTVFQAGQGEVGGIFLLIPGNADVRELSVDDLAEGERGAGESIPA